MPGGSYSLPRSACRMGSRLSRVPGTVCESCYGAGGCYLFRTTEAVLVRRLKSITHPKWEEAMISLISRKREKRFRWHDVGDLQNVEHLRRIARIAEATPEYRHWLPTKEIGILRRYLRTASVPSNLRIGFSSPWINRIDRPSDLPAEIGLYSVHTDPQKILQHHPVCRICPVDLADTPGAGCENCDLCWDRSVPHVSFAFH